MIAYSVYQLLFWQDTVLLKSRKCNLTYFIVDNYTRTCIYTAKCNNKMATAQLNTSRILSFGYIWLLLVICSKLYNPVWSSHQKTMFPALLQVCDEPHPMLVKNLLDHCIKGEFAPAHKILRHLWGLGYSAEDLVVMIFRVTKNHTMQEYIKLEFMRVSARSARCRWSMFLFDQSNLHVVW